MGRKSKQKKQNKKNRIQFGVNEHNQKKVVDRVLKNHTRFFINIGNYQHNYIGSNSLTSSQFLASKILAT